MARKWASVKASLRQGGRDLYYRWTGASKIGFFADITNIASISYSLWLAAWYLPRMRVTQGVPRLRYIALQTLAIVYTTFVYPRTQGRLKKKKWKREQVLRTQAVSLALNGLATGTSAGTFGVLEMNHIEHRLLQAMASEIETIFQDAEGIYFAVCLQVRKLTDPTAVVVLNRSNLDRDIGVTYRESELLASKAMQTGRPAYNPDYAAPDGQAEKPYKSIFALPILFTDADKRSRSLGAVSVDSARAHHFDGYEQQLEILLQPYVGLLAIDLVCRARCDVWPDFAR